MKQRRRSGLSTSGWLVAACFSVAAFSAGCTNTINTPPPVQTPTDDGGTADGGVLGSGALTTSTVVANNEAAFGLPFDSAPSPDGARIYFTGVKVDGDLTGPAIFSTNAAAASTPTALAVAGSLGAPLGVAVSSDGATVYAADPAFATASDKGAILSVPAAGGTPTALAETADYAPRAIAVAKVGTSDTIYFIGDDKADGVPGIFKDVAGAVTSVLKPIDAAAVAAHTDGTVYFIDAAGSVQKIAAGSTAAAAVGGASSGLDINYPAGIAVSQDGKFLLVPVTDAATGHQGIARIDASSGAVTQLPLSLPATNREAGGLHRAANADVYSFVDTGAGASGTVYLLQ